MCVYIIYYNITIACQLWNFAVFVQVTGIVAIVEELAFVEVGLIASISLLQTFIPNAFSWEEKEGLPHCLAFLECALSR